MLVKFLAPWLPTLPLQVSHSLFRPGALYGLMVRASVRLREMALLTSRLSEGSSTSASASSRPAIWPTIEGSASVMYLRWCAAHHKITSA